MFCKGIDTLTHAIDLFFVKDTRHAIVVIGSQKYHNSHHDCLRQNLEALAARHPGRLVILPSLEHATLLSIVHHCRAAVLPSAFDNLPNTVLEAMYLSRVIVATRGASIDEVIDDGREGILVDIGDATALAEAMIRVADMDETQRTTMGELAADKVRRVCDPNVVMPQILHCCEEAIQVHSLRRSRHLMA